ncbi:IQ motif and SEC7 domain-containing protein 1 isoform X1 [Lucilia cuprina]|uniref:IQ motif and SEC7 domain-containing protein 1 isoform X1 n=2 Tax=Lucilia cuprina TaxID=7375 RepID=UPI001F05DFCC|nr:IQ motif and SEC7 domain-containing protein 1 isoform X1 [Lucilia cuprina]XP_046809191.1 IQ motif and SEC7 domain-containing protein 1 isoform X2 [Lucilia cuprina]XP_046809192.1 IQ motif and SEC7 domain-containing protein 1 isoform X1 [Lucilia cuprina]XP_046809193.1 IQ motif and SEC7 domain-containing protein 1 isoform X1 [Lucilia cuprina]
MCDTKKQLSIDASSSGERDAGPGICDNIFDTISMTSDISADHIDHQVVQQQRHEYQQLQNQQKLQQTTQSLMMASAMLVGCSSNVVGVNNNSSCINSNPNNNNTNNEGDISYNNSQLQGHYSSSNIFGSTDSMNVPLMALPLSVIPTTTAMSNNGTPISQKTMQVNVHELIMENQSLRDKLKEITVDRDRLLCEVSNLRMELDMFELKRLPEETFPQKPIERSGSAQYGIAGIPGSNTSGSESGGYVYLQQHYVPTSASTNSSNSIPYPVDNQPSVVFQQHPQHYASCHQQQQQQQQLPMNFHTGGIHYAHHINTHDHGYHKNHHHHIHGHHQHHYHHGGAVVIAGSGVGTGIGSGGTSPSSMHHQNANKKNTIRNGSEVLKRSRTQSAYELSQDLLEKQIELLERKYGGVRARNAAITIQRAFRHYMMVKKFASITAMAKAEKRLSRRTMVVSGAAAVDDAAVANTSMSSAYSSKTESQLESNQSNTVSAQGTQQQIQPRVTIMPGPPGSVGHQSLASGSRTPPTRSLSMRERRHVDGGTIPRSQSGASNTSVSSSVSTGVTGSSHPHVNLLHTADPHYYAAHSLSGGQMAAYCGSYHSVQHDGSFASSANSSHLDSSLNVSWVNASGTSPHTPYYSAAQIYMRPRGSSTSSQDRKKVPPEVPKRTSSITAQQHAQHLAAQQQQLQMHQQMMVMRQTPPPPSLIRSNGLCKSAENGSLTSVQSSGSDSSATSVERNAISDLGSDRSNSPNTWKRGTNLNSSQQFVHTSDPAFAHAQNSAAMAALVSGVAPVEDHAISSHTSAAQYEHHEQHEHQQIIVTATQTPPNYKVSETIRKRQYRVGLNLFNKKPEKGITYLIRRGFLENTPQGVARFLITRKGLSRQMIGEYLGNLQNQFNMAVLNCFAMELDLSGMQVDVALRKFQAYFRMPGEAQKIERLMEIFSQRFCQCNQDIVGRLRSSDTIFVLAFAIIMLNTDLHTPNLKPERRMRVEDFIKNLRGIDDCHDIDKDMLAGIYERVKANEFKPGSDHVTQVMKVQATIVGKKPNLALPHRRLVCYCRLYEIPDINKKERPGVHQREVFLFNDLLVITKIFSKKKSSVTYTFRNSFPLCGMVVTLLDVPNYPFCIQLSQKVDGKILVTFNARNEHDRCKFAEDLKESICEMDEMESLRIEAELERQKSARSRATGNSENRDSGVADVEVCPCPYQTPQANEPAQNPTENTQQLKRSALSNSLLDIHEQFGGDKPQRRGSVGSLDSGMSISFQSTTTSNASRENAAVIAAAANAAAAKMRLGTTATAPAGGLYIAPGVQGYNQIAYIQQQHPHIMQQQHQIQQNSQHQQSQAPATGRIPGRERKLSRSEENRSTEV